MFYILEKEKRFCLAICWSSCSTYWHLLKFQSCLRLGFFEGGCSLMSVEHTGVVSLFMV